MFQIYSNFILRGLFSMSKVLGRSNETKSQEFPLSQVGQQNMSVTSKTKGHTKCPGSKFSSGAPKGIRTPASGLKGQCPRPLDDGGSAQGYITLSHQNGQEVFWSCSLSFVWQIYLSFLSLSWRKMRLPRIIRCTCNYK